MDVLIFIWMYRPGTNLGTPKRPIGAEKGAKQDTPLSSAAVMTPEDIYNDLFSAMAFSEDMNNDIEYYSLIGDPFDKVVSHPEVLSGEQDQTD
jgi:hypothetical protein